MLSCIATSKFPLQIHNLFSKKLMLLCIKLSGNTVRSVKSLSLITCLCLYSGSDLGKLTLMAVGMGSRGQSVCSVSSVSGEGANSGEGGDVPSSMLCKDTTWTGLQCVFTSPMLLSLSWSSSFLVLLCWQLLLSVFRWFKSKLGYELDSSMAWKSLSKLSEPSLDPFCLTCATWHRRWV